jgi:PKHD-type hydroxylase
MYVLTPNKKVNWARFCWYEKAFTEEECDKIVQLSKSIQTQQAEIKGSKPVNLDIRNSNIKWLTCNDDTKWIFDKLCSYAQDCNQIRYGLDLTGYTEPLQFTEYTKGGHYDWHQDFSSGDLSIRKLSQVLLLSDPKSYKGGDLTFFKDTTKIPNTKGTLINFPSFEFHKVEPILKGKRHSLVAWISGNPFK